MGIHNGHFCQLHPLIAGCPEEFSSTWACGVFFPSLFHSFIPVQNVSSLEFTSNTRCIWEFLREKQVKPIVQCQARSPSPKRKLTDTAKLNFCKDIRGYIRKMFACPCCWSKHELSTDYLHNGIKYILLCILTVVFHMSWSSQRFSGLDSFEKLFLWCWVTCEDEHQQSKSSLVEGC